MGPYELCIRKEAKIKIHALLFFVVFCIRSHISNTIIFSLFPVNFEYQKMFAVEVKIPLSFVKLKKC